MHILFHKLFRDQHTAELHRMRPEVSAILREREAQRDLRNLRLAIARDKRNAGSVS